MSQSDTATAPPKALKIVTRISPNKNPTTTTQQEYHTVYHWDRIIIVSALILVGVLALSYLSYTALTGLTKRDSSSATTLTVQSTNKQSTNEQSANKQSADEPSIVEQPTETAEASTTSATNLPNKPTALSKEIEPANLAQAISPEKEPTIQAEAQDLESPTKPPLTVEPHSANLTTQNNDSKPANPPEVTIHSKDINRAIFTHTLKNKEPNTIITDTVPIDRSGLSRVYFFNDVRDRAGDTLIHTWYRNGKEIVKVRLPIGSDLWRGSSSKYLDKTMPGQWEVKVTDKKGKLVAEGAFQFTTS